MVSVFLSACNYISRTRLTHKVKVTVVQSPIKLILDLWKLNCYVEGRFITRLRFNEKKLVIYKLTGPRFLANPPLAVNK